MLELVLKNEPELAGLDKQGRVSSSGWWGLEVVGELGPLGCFGHQWSAGPQGPRQLRKGEMRKACSGGRIAEKGFRQGDTAVCGFRTVPAPGP